MGRYCLRRSITNAVQGRWPWRGSGRSPGFLVLIQCLAHFAEGAAINVDGDGDLVGGVADGMDIADLGGDIGGLAGQQPPTGTFDQAVAAVGGVNIIDGFDAGLQGADDTPGAAIVRFLRGLT